MDNTISCKYKYLSVPRKFLTSKPFTWIFLTKHLLYASTASRQYTKLCCFLCVAEKFIQNNGLNFLSEVCVASPPSFWGSSIISIGLVFATTSIGLLDWNSSSTISILLASAPRALKACALIIITLISLEDAKLSSSLNLLLL